MSAPNDLAVWMNRRRHKDKKLPHLYLYHSRSDAHSVELCLLITRDLLQACRPMQRHAALGQIAYGVNVEHFWATSGKAKSLDLAIGIPKEKPMITGDMRRVASSRRKSGESPSVDRNIFSRILIAC